MLCKSLSSSALAAIRRLSFFVGSAFNDGFTVFAGKLKISSVFIGVHAYILAKDWGRIYA